MNDIIEAIGNLLAVIHRDGGHYEAEHGILKACADAEQVVQRERLRTLHDLAISEYDAGGDICIRAAPQADGTIKWKVVNIGGSVLNTDGQWEYEPMPSSRTAEYLARCRYASAELALAELDKWSARRVEA